MIKLICIGKIKDKNLKALCDEYIKRLKKYQKIEVIEISDEAIPNNLNDNLRKQILDKEGEKALKKVKDQEIVFLLDVYGKQYSSKAFSEKISEINTYQSSDITFIIGGSLGVSEQLRSRANYLLSLSKMTFVHQMTRLIILEQIYRAFKILNNENYDK